MTAEEWFAGKDADPIMMSLRDVFNANQNGKEQKLGGSVLRQASRRLAADQIKPNQRDSQIETQSATPSSASVSKLGSMRPPESPLNESSNNLNASASNTPATSVNGAAFSVSEIYFNLI